MAPKKKIIVKTVPGSPGPVIGSMSDKIASAIAESQNSDAIREEQLMSDPSEAVAYFKPKRTRRPPAPAPEPPNPTVMALQEQILHFVNQREDLQRRSAEAKAALARVQADVLFFQERLHQVEAEVDYRLNLIANLKGNAPFAMHGLVPNLGDLAGKRLHDSNSGIPYSPTVAGDIYPTYGGLDRSQMPASVPAQGVGFIPAPNQQRPGAVYAEAGGIEVNLGDASAARNVV